MIKTLLLLHSVGAERILLSYPTVNSFDILKHHSSTKFQLLYKCLLQERCQCNTLNNIIFEMTVIDHKWITKKSESWILHLKGKWWITQSSIWQLTFFIPSLSNFEHHSPEGEKSQAKQNTLKIQFFQHKRQLFC